MENKFEGCFFNGNIRKIKVLNSCTVVIVETEGSIRKMQKRSRFHYKKVKKGTPNLTSPYLHSLFTNFLIKQIFEKNKSSKAAFGNRTQF